MARRYTRRQAMVAGTAAGGGLIALLLSIPAIGFVLSPLWTRTRRATVRVGPIGHIKVGIPTALYADVPTGDGWQAPPVKRVVYVVKNQDGSMKALSNICSHMQCDVHWAPDLGQFLCPCHGGLYDMQGTNIGGPPPSPLPQWVHEVRREAGQDVLYITNQFDESI